MLYTYKGLPGIPFNFICLMEQIEEITDNFDKKMVTAGVLLMDHNILIS